MTTEPDPLISDPTPGREWPRDPHVTTEVEKGILFDRVTQHVETGLRRGVRPGGVTEGMFAVVADVATIHALRYLRSAMTARQLAVLLAEEPNRHERRLLNEPPRYYAHELAENDL